MSKPKIAQVFNEWRNPAIVFAFIVLLALILRLYNLTILPVFVDEAIYIRWSQIMAHEPTLRFLPLSDGKQPLFMWVLMTFVHKLSDPLIAGRLVSVGSGIGTIIGIAFLSFILFKSKVVSLVSALMWALAPFAVLFDRLALVDSMLTFFGVWTVSLAVLTARYACLDLAMITGFALGAALLTKSPAIFFVLLLPAAVLLAHLPKLNSQRLLHLIKLVILLSVIYAIAFALYNILRLGPNFHMIGLRNIDYVWPITHVLKSPLDPFIPHFSRSLEWIWTMGGVSVYILFFVSLVVNFRKNWKALLFVLAFGLTPIMINSAYAKVLTARYILFSIPYIFVFASASFLTTKPLLKKLSAIVFAIFIVQAIWFNNLLLTDPQKAPLPRSERSGYLEEWTAGTGIKQVADYLKAEHAKEPNRQIVVGTEGFFGTLPDGLQIYMEGTPKVTVIGVGLGIDRVHQSLKDSKGAGNKTYLVANSSRLNFKEPIETYGLKVVEAYKKADRPDGFREYVQFGPFDSLYLFEVLDLPSTR